MITYEIPVLIGAENTDDGPLIKTHDSGVNLQVKLLRMKRVSSWREIPEPYIIPEGTTAVFRAKNPDGTKTVVDVTPEPGKNTVFCELPPEALPTKGTCKAEIVLYSTAGERLTSATFCYRVEAECVCDDDPESEDYVDVFKDLKEKVVDLETQVDEALGPEHIQNAVTEYLKENPVEAGATAEEAEQIQQNKADIEQLTQDKLDAGKLPEAVNDALAQAKASGEFKGEPGYTPVKGVDYFDGEPGDDYILTDADKTEIAKLAAEMVEVPEGGSSDAVQYVEQTLTEEQQMQARKNLGLYGITYEYDLLRQDGPNYAGYVWTLDPIPETINGDYRVEIWDVSPRQLRFAANLQREGHYNDLMSGGSDIRWFWGNPSLIKNDSEAAEIFSKYTDTVNDCPIVLYTAYHDDYGYEFTRLYISPDLQPSYWLGFVVKIMSTVPHQVVNQIPEEYLPDSFNEPGEAGGYYTPNVEQTDANTMKVSYTASKEDMPSVAEQSITLPAGPKGDKYELTEADKQEIAELTAPLVDVPSGGGGSGGGSEKWRKLGEVILDEDVTEVTWFSIDADMDGNPIDLQKMLFVIANKVQSGTSPQMYFRAYKYTNGNVNYVVAGANAKDGLKTVIFCELVKPDESITMLKTIWNNNSLHNAPGGNVTWHEGLNQSNEPSYITGCTFQLNNGMLAGTKYTLWGVDRV